MGFVVHTCLTFFKTHRDDMYQHSVIFFDSILWLQIFFYLTGKTTRLECPSELKIIINQKKGLQNYRSGSFLTTQSLKYIIKEDFRALRSSQRIIDIHTKLLFNRSRCKSLYRFAKNHTANITSKTKTKSTRLQQWRNSCETLSERFGFCCVPMLSRMQCTFRLRLTSCNWTTISITARTIAVC